MEVDAPGSTSPLEPDGLRRVVVGVAGTAAAATGFYTALRLVRGELDMSPHMLLSSVLLGLTAWRTARGGSIEAGTLLTLGVGFALTSGETIFVGGVWHGAMAYLAVVGAVASALLRPPWGARFTVAAIAVGALAAWGHTHGVPLIDGPPRPERLGLDVLDHVVGGVILAITTRAFVRRLESAEHAAEEEAEVRARFLRVICHQIRTPLNGVLGMAQALSASVQSDPERGLIASLERSARALVSLFDDVLDYAQAESGALHITPAPFAIRTLVGDVVRLFEARARERGIALVVDLDDAAEAAGVEGDGGRLRQILTNLVSNAIKFTERGQVRVEVRSVGPSRWRFAVEDTGIGIAPEVLPRLFAPFVQAATDGGARYAGAGLGLAISRRVAEALDGRLDATSKLGVGSRFVLELPLPEVAVDARPAAPIEPTKLSGHVLVVEDNRVNQRVVTWMLDRLGLSYVVTSSAEDGLAALDHHAFDLVLMDVQLPGIDGLAATRQLRARVGAGVPVVGLSAHATDRDRIAAAEAGMVAYLTKPLELRALRETVSAVLVGQTIPVAPQRSHTPPSARERATRRYQRAMLLALACFGLIYSAYSFVDGLGIPTSILVMLASLPITAVLSARVQHQRLVSALILVASSVALVGGALEGPGFWEGGLPMFMALGPMAVLLGMPRAWAWSAFGVAAGPALALAERASLYLSAPRVPDPWLGAVDLATSATLITTFTERFATEAREREAATRNLARERVRFLASLGHEIRTPMNGVLGLCELLAGARAPGVDLDQLHTLRASAQELLRIVDQLIDFVRLEEGRLPLASETFQPDAEVRAAVVAAQLEVETTSAGEASELVPVRVSIARGAGRAVQGDARRVRQLVRALVSNALRFSHNGAVEVALTRDGDALVVEILDRGPGISEARVALVFQPFHAERSRRGLGVGLGLATAKRLAERMGGALTVQSAVGGGTRVRLQVPVTPPPARGLPAPSPRLGRGDRVLVVDDDATNRHVATLMLARLGLEADGVASGAEAVEVALRGGHALVLLDLGLPDLDGAEVARRVRAAEDPSRRLPIYALTGSDDEEERCAALDAGVDAILEKPLRAATLHALLDAPVILDGRTGATGTLPPPPYGTSRPTSPPPSA